LLIDQSQTLHRSNSDERCRDRAFSAYEAVGNAFPSIAEGEITVVTL
jgi:hypothetical protein